MNAKPAYARRHAATTVVAAGLSVLVATGALSGIAGLFRSAGTPFAQLVAAERACADHAFESERKACVASFPGAASVQHVASR